MADACLKGARKEPVGEFLQRTDHPANNLRKGPWQFLLEIDMTDMVGSEGLKRNEEHSIAEKIWARQADLYLQSQRRGIH
jgi:hypothetical protein